MTEKDVLAAALEHVRQNRYANASLYLADIVASLAFGGNHRKVDLSRFDLLDERTRLMVFDLITAKVKGAYPLEEWERVATKILEATKGARV